MYFLLSVWTERRNKKEPRTRSAVEQMGFPVSGCGSPLTQSSPETTPKSLICYRRLPLSFAQLTPRHLSWQTCEAVLIMISSSRRSLNLRDLNKNLGFRLPFLAMAMLKQAWHCSSSLSKWFDICFVLSSAFNHLPLRSEYRMRKSKKNCVYILLFARLALSL